ncbi:hypothetical protein B0H14DRAFT_2639115 [Mycena olivaceomarginata]|nr:hypothetical protein B0H14DRAFT_2639115 [Mycena olivaceomarginata]
MCLRFLSTWEALEALVVLLQENIGKKFLERYGVPQLALELRIVVIICSDYHEDRAEDFITKHKSREIDPLKYCIPEPDEDDYGQEDSEDEIDEEWGRLALQPFPRCRPPSAPPPQLPPCPVTTTITSTSTASSVTSATLSAVSPATCLSSAGTMPFGSQLAVNNEFNFVLGLSTDELTNDGVTVRINTSNWEDFALTEASTAAAGSPATPPPHLPTTRWAAHLPHSSRGIHVSLLCGHQHRDAKKEEGGGGWGREAGTQGARQEELGHHCGRRHVPQPFGACPGAAPTSPELCTLTLSAASTL